MFDCRGVRTYSNIYIYICVCVCIHIYIYIYIFIYAYMHHIHISYIYIHIYVCVCTHNVYYIYTVYTYVCVCGSMWSEMRLCQNPWYHSRGDKHPSMRQPFWCEQQRDHAHMMYQIVWHHMAWNVDNIFKKNDYIYILCWHYYYCRLLQLSISGSSMAASCIDSTHRKQNPKQRDPVVISEPFPWRPSHMTSIKDWSREESSVVIVAKFSFLPLETVEKSAVDQPRLANVSCQKQL